MRELGDDETLLVQSGKPVAVFQTHADAPRVLIANSNLVPHWATQAHFDELAAKGLIMYGQMTAGSWIYIGSQGILQGTFETFTAAARQHFAKEEQVLFPMARRALGEEEARCALAYWNITSGGNFEHGTSIPHAPDALSTAAGKLGLGEAGRLLKGVIRGNAPAP